MLYGSWDIEHNGQNFLWFLTNFAFLPPYNRDKKLFEKIKNQMPGDIILHMCTINENHMMNGSWDMKRDRPNVLSFWLIFCTFSPLPTQKIKILKNRKKVYVDISWEIIKTSEMEKKPMFHFHSPWKCQKTRGYRVYGNGTLA